MFQDLKKNLVIPLALCLPTKVLNQLIKSTYGCASRRGDKTGSPERKTPGAKSPGPTILIKDGENHLVV